MRPVKRSRFAKDFGERVRELRTARGVSQEQLGFDAGLHRTAVSFIERAQRSATLETIEKLARALGVEPSELMPKLRR
ncbi:MAG: helix-turn-helix transcriptional regulator [Phycisphaerales bacterium]|nr:helix-turn-helix transcriptional regulator [Phycisphaerales bacterium]